MKSLVGTLGTVLSCMLLLLQPLQAQQQQRLAVATSPSNTAFSPAEPPTPLLTPEQTQRLAYYERYVLPAFAAQRLRLEQALSAPDKQELAAITTRMRSILHAWSRLRFTNERSPSPQQQQQLKQLELEEQQTKARLAPLRTKHQALLADIAQQLASQRAHWLIELATIPQTDLSKERQAIDYLGRPDVLFLSLLP